MPNVFTAAADSLSGWLLVGGLLSNVTGWLPLVLASMAIYAAGIALNDVFDLELDRIERPGRPLPSGQVSRRFAIVLSVILLAMGLGLASSVGMRPALVSVALVASVVAYDVGVRRSIFGPELMGTCRGLNVLLGISLADDFGGPAAWAVAGGMAIFIVGVTWISRFENESGKRAAPASGMILQILGIAALAWAALSRNAFPSPTLDPTFPPLLGLLLLAAVSSRILWASRLAVADPKPKTLRGAVKTGILSLIWLHVAVLASVRGPEAALAVAALWIPAALAARWFATT